MLRGEHLAPTISLSCSSWFTVGCEEIFPGILLLCRAYTGGETFAFQTCCWNHEVMKREGWSAWIWLSRGQQFLCMLAYLFLLSGIWERPLDNFLPRPHVHMLKWYSHEILEYTPLKTNSSSSERRKGWNPSPCDANFLWVKFIFNTEKYLISL